MLKRALSILATVALSTCAIAPAVAQDLSEERLNYMEFVNPENYQLKGEAVHQSYFGNYDVAYLEVINPFSADCHDVTYYASSWGNVAMLHKFVNAHEIGEVPVGNDKWKIITFVREDMTEVVFGVNTNKEVVNNDLCVLGFAFPVGQPV